MAIKHNYANISDLAKQKVWVDPEVLITKYPVFLSLSHYTYLI